MKERAPDDNWTRVAVRMSTSVSVVTKLAGFLLVVFSGSILFFENVPALPAWHAPLNSHLLAASYFMAGMMMLALNGPAPRLLRAIALAMMALGATLALRDLSSIQGIFIMLLGLWAFQFPSIQKIERRIPFGLIAGALLLSLAVFSLVRGTMMTGFAFADALCGGIVLFIAYSDRIQIGDKSIWSLLILPVAVWLMIGTMVIALVFERQNPAPRLNELSEVAIFPWVVLGAGSLISALLVWTYWLVQRTAVSARELIDKNEALNEEIHERANIENELRRIQDQLEIKIAERTELLTRSNQELEQYAFISSHDLQEPVRKVANYLDLLLIHSEGDLSPEARKDIERIMKAVQQMKTLLSELMELMRVRNSNVAFESVNLSEEVHHVLSGINNIEEVSVFIDSLPVVMGDRLRLRQVFHNLISNAVKFRAADKPTVHLSAHQNGPEWTISIRDNGIGIEPEQKNRIFEIFQRLRPRQYPGAGIGLSICKKIVESYGGKLWVESAPGYGSTFKFTLPSAREPREIKRGRPHIEFVAG